MALWLVRAGKYGEFENHFLAHDLVNLTWEMLVDTDLGAANSYDELKELVRAAYPNESQRKLGNWAGQIWSFVQGIKVGDWVVLPRKTQGAIAVGQVTGSYQFVAKADPMQRHVRAVKWLNKGVPRSVFEQDLLYSFGAYMTICEIRRNDAENRVRALAKSGWKGDRMLHAKEGVIEAAEPMAESGSVDLARLASDQIARRIEQLFKGHGLARLVAAILEAQGYQTHVSPAGPDKGVDILAAPDPLGFGSPRICVQVKSGDAPVDRPTLDQLIGVMQNMGAEQGLLVSWGGFKSSVEKEKSSQFFRVRLWDADALIEQMLVHYDRLPADIRADIPLQRIWTVAPEEEAA